MKKLCLLSCAALLSGESVGATSLTGVVLNDDDQIIRALLVPSKSRANPCPATPPSDEDGVMTLRPGEVDEYAWYACVWQAKKLTCAELMRNVINRITPEFTGGAITTFSSTAFTNPRGGGGMQGGLPHSDNPFTFGVWIPSISEYALEGSGLACGLDYLISAHIGIKVEQPAISFLTGQSKCPPVAYAETQNTVGITGSNPAFPNEAGCSIAYGVTQPSYAAQYGFLQVMTDGDIDMRGKIEGQGGDMQDFHVAILDLGSDAVDCGVEQGGGYQPITNLQTLQAGKTANMVYAGTTSIFTAPYYSPTTCSPSKEDLGAITRYDNTLTQYYNYLMMKADPQEGKVSYWIPVQMAGWYAVYGAACRGEAACGLGLGTAESPYYNDWSVEGAYSNNPKWMGYWLQTPSAPTWGSILQESYRTVSKIMQNESYWFSCPASINPKPTPPTPTPSSFGSLLAQSGLQALGILLGALLL